MSRFERMRASLSWGQHAQELSWRPLAGLAATVALLVWLAIDGSHRWTPLALHSKTPPAHQSAPAIPFVAGAARQVGYFAPISAVPSLTQPTPARLRHQRGDYIVEAPDLLTIEVQADEPLAESLAQVAGEYLVDPNGNLALAGFDPVTVGGLTLDDATKSVRKALGTTDDVQVNVVVSGPNSKVYYIIQNEPGACDCLQREPVLADETVRDALQKLSPDAIKGRSVWIARPGQGPNSTDTILLVNAANLLAGTDLSTDHPLEPGDRIFVAEEPGFLDTLWQLVTRHWDTISEYLP